MSVFVSRFFEWLYANFSTTLHGYLLIMAAVLGIGVIVRESMEEPGDQS